MRMSSIHGESRASELSALHPASEESASKSKFKKSEPNTDKNDYIFSDSVDYFLVSPISKK
jgi:hypothetical protein